MDAPQATPDDINLFVVVVHQIERWWQWLITGGLVAFGALIWRVSAQWAEARRDLRDHAQRLDKHEGRIGALETGHLSIAVKLESLPTRAELAAQAARVDERFDRLDKRLDRIADGRAD